jgi:hypothetical protein
MYSWGRLRPEYVDIQVEKFKLFFKFQIGGFKLIFDEKSQFFDEKSRENAPFSMKMPFFRSKKRVFYSRNWLDFPPHGCSRNH